MAYNLTAQMEKYDAAEVEADIKNLDEELADEDAVNTTLLSDAAERLAAAQAFVTDNAARIQDQHARMQTRAKNLRDMVATNVQLENVNEDYKKFVASDEAQRVAQLLTEINAMSLQYRELLLDTGRSGRPPLFQ